ncbi:Putative peptidoglycan binding domain-containing protein [Shimia gijangensis]|uniref:Putative peptidoglycan binding domain-containing protein n=1 Tax=Shimia gijangensis TaxID=1470563 RepID=A0A1M6D138_9RHOB|nr:peptidoglycan-binding domain-containing protein [Shimia gijangensis]SHI67002.1 Putative peptidoglycan binding domain-containing protein [Shimia gijangensis]
MTLPIHRFRTLTCALPIIWLAACDPTNMPAPDLGALAEPDVVRSTATNAPPGASPGTCWGREVSPATIETVTEQVLIQPAEVLADGTVISPAIYRSETQQRIVEERREIWFETPCDSVWTEEFTSTLQRALKARGLYTGTITGTRDKRTRAAIRRYQAPQGLNSSILSLEAARQLGLVAVEREG